MQPGLAVVLSATTGTDTTRYVHGSRGIHAQQDSAGAWDWLVQDGLGSVRAVVDGTLAVQERRMYAPYGEPYDGMGTNQTVYGFTGEPTDVNELVYLRARYYNPNIGVFTALDPFEGIPQQPMSLNGYSWVEGNVVTQTDASGRTWRLAAMLNSALCSVSNVLFQSASGCNQCQAILAAAGNVTGFVRDILLVQYQVCMTACNMAQSGTPTLVIPGTNTPQPTVTPAPSPTPLPPTPSPTPTDSPEVHPCTTRNIFPVFGTCGEKCTPRIAGSGYTDSHRAVDIVPIGAYEQYPQSTYLAPDWSTRPQTQDYNEVYAMAEGTVYTIPSVPDAIVLRLSDTWEFAYVHIQPSVTSGSVTAGTQLGVVIPYSQASQTIDISDRDHLHLGLRNPVNLSQALDPSPCLQGLTG